VKLARTPRKSTIVSRPPCVILMSI
jgi:hypothetical protein